MPRLEFAKDLIVDLLINLTREKNLYKADVTINFRWGASMHVGVEGFDLNRGIDELFDKLDQDRKGEVPHPGPPQERKSPPREEE